MKNFRHNLLGKLSAPYVGPVAITLLAALLLILDYVSSTPVPNPSVWFLVLLMLIALQGNLISILVSNLIALGVTLWLFDRLGYIGFSGRPLAMLIFTVCSFPIASALLLFNRRRFIAAIAKPAQDEQTLFRAVMNSMHDAIVESDWKGIRHVNASFCKMTGFTREELIGAKAPFPFWPPEQYASIATALETSMRGGALDFELILTRKNGERFPVLLSVSRILDGTVAPTTAPGGTKSTNRVLYSFRDITDLKNAQGAAERANRTKDQFINLLSHELRSPLTPILTLGSMLETDDRLPADVKADINTIRRSAEVEAALIDNLLDLVRLAKEEKHPMPAPRGAALTPVVIGPRAPLPPIKKPLRILLVEDHADTSKTLARLLTARGHTISIAPTCAAAAAAVTAEPFDFLISDLGLPDGSGHDLLRALNRIRPLPAIALSGFASPEDIRESRAAGFLQHLIKPVDPKTLDEAIERLAN